jgi:hypothetical protein
MDVVQKISEVPADPKQMATQRVEIQAVTLRDKPAPEPEPLSTAADGDKPLTPISSSNVRAEWEDQ